MQIKAFKDFLMVYIIVIKGKSTYNFQVSIDE